MQQIDSALQFLPRGEDGCPLPQPDAKQPEQHTHKQLDRRQHRAEDRDKKRYDTGDGQRNAVREIDRQHFRQHFGEHHHQHGHDDCGIDHAAFAKHGDE